MCCGGGAAAARAVSCVRACGAHVVRLIRASRRLANSPPARASQRLSRDPLGPCVALHDMYEMVVPLEREVLGLHVMY